MKMFEKDGVLTLNWKEGARILIDGRGDTADTLLALCAGLKGVIEERISPEKQAACAREVAELFLSMMQMGAVKVDLGAMKGGASDDTV